MKRLRLHHLLLHARSEPVLRSTSAFDCSRTDVTADVVELSFLADLRALDTWSVVKKGEHPLLKMLYTLQMH